MTRAGALAALLLAAVPGTAAAQERIAPGTVVVEPLPDAMASLPVRKLVTEAVIHALGDAGFTPLPAGGPARYVARATLVRADRGAVTTPGGGAEVGAYPGGLMMGFGGGKRVSGLAELTLTIAVYPQGGERAVWTGTAVTVQADASEDGRPDRIAPRLAAAAMSGFPYQRAEPASVP